MTDHRIIQLSKGKVVLVDLEDYEEISRYKWHTVGDKYAARSVGGRKNKKMVYMHRLILNANDDWCVDHINGDTFDNRKKNLRLVTQHENQANSRKHQIKTSVYKGVYWDKSRLKWAAKIKTHDKAVFLGRFKTEREAAEAYNDAALRLFGQYAFLNEGLK
jgi:helix-turn-helix protein